MKTIHAAEYKPGRRFLGRLPHGKDLIESIEIFCRENSIRTATFSIIGALSSATFGAYDQKQQVYVTHKEEGFLEIITCTGNISLKDGNVFAHAHAILSDEQGKTLGGHIFNESILFAGEIDLQELSGPDLVREYDAVTGLMLWNIP